MERKKLIWIIVSACLVLAIVAIAGIVILDPQGKNPNAPAFSRPSPRGSVRDYVPSPAPSASPLVPFGDSTQAFGVNDALPSPRIVPMDDGTTLFDMVPGSSGSPAGQGTAATPPPAASARPAASPRPAASSRPAPTPTPKPRTAAAATPKPARTAAPRTSDYWIQAASFISRGNADDLKSYLKDKGMDSVIITSEVNGKTMYRVRIGPFSTKSEANGWLSRVRALKDCTDAIVVKSPRGK